MDAVIALAPPLQEVVSRVRAVVEFQRLPEAQALAGANKRIRNILRKSESTPSTVRVDLLVEPAEKSLHTALQALDTAVESHLSRRDYAAALQALAGARGAVDAFFEKVMVNADDAAVRANRLALLLQLDTLMNRVADISRLAA